MKKIGYIIAILLIANSFTSCEESEIPFYSDVDRINFMSTDPLNEFSNYDLVSSADFTKVLSDELEIDILVYVQGRTANVDRKVAFKVTDVTPIGVISGEIVETVVKAGENKGVLKVKVKRPTTEEILTSELVIDAENSDFEVGSADRQKFTVNASFIYTYEGYGIYEDWWENDAYMDYDLGSWSFGKARFISVVTGYENLNSWIDMMWEDYDNYDQKIAELKTALEEYKKDPKNTPIYDETQFPEKVWIDFEL